VLFSSDLTQPWQKVLEYYCLRFQIEFNFRDSVALHYASVPMISLT
jgi:hypothetical protein